MRALDLNRSMRGALEKQLGVSRALRDELAALEGERGAALRRAALAEAALDASRARARQLRETPAVAPSPRAHLCGVARA